MEYSRPLHGYEMARYRLREKTVAKVVQDSHDTKKIENHESIFAIQHHVSPYLHRSCSCKEWATNQYLTRSTQLFVLPSQEVQDTALQHGLLAASCSFIIRMIRMRISKANSMCPSILLYFTLGLTV